MLNQQQPQLLALMAVKSKDRTAIIALEKCNGCLKCFNSILEMFHCPVSPQNEFPHMNISPGSCVLNPGGPGLHGVVREPEGGESSIFKCTFLSRRWPPLATELSCSWQRL